MEFGRVVIANEYINPPFLLTQTTLHCLLCGEKGLWIKHAEVNTENPDLTKPAEAYCSKCERSFTYLVKVQTGIDSLIAARIRTQRQWQNEEELKRWKERNKA